MQGSKRVLFDAVLIFVLHYLGMYMDFYWMPVRRGFHREDSSITYEKQENTITPPVLLVGSIFCPMVIMLLIDVISGVRGWDIYHTVVVFEIGGLLVYVSNNLLKYYTGLPRPFFLSVCKPDWTKIDNTGSQYVADPKCTGDETEIKIGSLTFPSLHSSLTGYGITYFMVFLHHHYTSVHTGYRFAVISSALQVASITWSVLVFMSRVLDRWHHVIDVIAGAAWGFLIAVIVILRILPRSLITHKENDNRARATSIRNSVGKSD